MLLDYRKDIDGLRAIAVMLVVLFHAGFAIPGGFIGVDIFFVISGFLIASLIKKQILRNKFTFTGFYLHRMRRILPALLLVILATLLFNWLFLMPNEFNFFVKSALFSLLSVSNIFFWKDSKNYFSADTEQIQLLHTWSLSVEEQFYIGVPIFLIILFKYFYKTKWFNYILGFVLLFSFIVSQYLALKHFTFAYYNLPARFFELFIGVWLALNYDKLPIVKHNLFNNILAFVGLLLIFIPAFILSKSSVFPGLNALFVCLGSAIIIYLGKLEEKTFVSRLLSIKPLVFIGLISYSLYLWHWPVFATMKIIGLKLPLFGMFIVVLALILLSYLSWLLVEQPFRHKFKKGFISTFVLLFALPLMLMYLLYFYVSNYENSLIKVRISEQYHSLINSYTTTAKSVEKLCFNKIREDKKLNNFDCIIGQEDKKIEDVFFYGDSHANSLAGFIEVVLKDAGLKAKISTNGSLLVLNEMDISSEISRLERRSLKKMDKFVNNSLLDFRNNVEKTNYKYIIIGGYYSAYYAHYSHSKDYANKFINNVKYIVDNGKIPVIIKDTPAINKNLPLCAIYNKIFNLSNNCNIDKQKVLNTHNKVEDIFLQIKELYPQTIFIDPKAVMCDNTKCLTNEDEFIFYSDGDHLTYPSSKYLGNKYLKEVGNPFKS